MKKVFHWVWSILEVIIIVYVIIMTAYILNKNKYGYTQFGNYTFHNISLFDEKNVQNTKNGDLLVVKNSNDIKEGDVIYYYAPYNESYILRTDAVVAMESDDYSSLYTVDHGGAVTISSNRVIGKYATTYHKIGAVVGVLESRIGFLFLVLLPIMIVFIYQVYEFVIILRYETVEDEAEEIKEEKPKKKKETVKSSDEDVEIL